MDVRETGRPSFNGNAKGYSGAPATGGGLKLRRAPRTSSPEARCSKSCHGVGLDMCSSRAVAGESRCETSFRRWPYEKPDPFYSRVRKLASLLEAPVQAPEERQAGQIPVQSRA